MTGPSATDIPDCDQVAFTDTNRYVLGAAAVNDTTSAVSDANVNNANSGVILTRRRLNLRLRAGVRFAANIAAVSINKISIIQSTVGRRNI